MDNDIDLVVFNDQPGNIKRVVFGEKHIGTTVSNNIEERNKKIMANTIVEKAKEDGPVTNHLLSNLEVSTVVPTQAC